MLLPATFSHRRTKQYSRSSSNAPFGDLAPTDLATIGVPAPPPKLLSTAINLQPTAPPVPLAASARAYRASIETPLGQKNHQKWCLGPKLVDLCNLSPFWHCTRLHAPPAVAVVPPHAPHSSPGNKSNTAESRSEEISTVQAPTSNHTPPEGSIRHSRASRVIHAPRGSYHTPTCASNSSHALPSARAYSGA
jgi:hypothetical protein